MKIISSKKEYLYELERLCSLFFPNEKHEFAEAGDFKGDYLFADSFLKEDGIEIEVVFNYGGEKREDKCKESLDELKYADEELILARHVYEILSSYTGKKQKWGILTGVRPVKLIGKAIEEGMGYDDLRKAFVEKRLLSAEKFNLAYKTYFNEKKIRDLSQKDSFSLYVGIPFCPSRCSYCSFVSQSVEKSKKILDPYLESLCKEVEYTGELVKKLGLKLMTVYIGGGTPTVLSAEQLTKLTNTINRSFDVKNALEYTIEAGRPDTITREKLEAIKNSGAGRISINPQTFNNDVLKAIGRKHSAEDTVKMIELARSMGFDNINTDIIAGLPTDTPESFKRTVDELIKINPENITVHTLSIKRSAYISDKKIENDDIKNTEEMVEYSQNKLLEYGYEPYYLYRQKNMLGNLENTGYCKKGFDGLYNVYIMDETHTILACGAGSMTKIRLPESGRIERIPNFKFPYEYINNFEEILNRKGRIIELYEKDNI